MEVQRADATHEGDDEADEDEQVDAGEGARTLEGDEEEREERPRGHENAVRGRVPLRQEGVDEGLREGHRVERDVEAVGEPEEQAGRAAERGAERARDHVVGAAAAHPAVGGEGGEGGDGEVGDQLGEAEDGEGARPTHHPDGEADAEEEDRSEDVEEARNVAAIERVQIVVAGGCEFGVLVRRGLEVRAAAYRVPQHIIPIEQRLTAPATRPPLLSPLHWCSHVQ
mmetsp:Transcript_21845/g.54459  ORF Transcript_21845/g.54459 Transcript_21845/m.54459 type:complete len:226 (-) Transcript_21845:52-729(-)